MSLLNAFNGTGDLPDSVRAALAVFCAPTPPKVWTMGDALQALSMWGAMVLAMMLPSATPVFSITTGRTPRAVATAALLGLGYLSVWFGFAVVAVGLESLLVAVRVMQAAMVPMTDVLAATTMIAAGVYQFTPWKAACLRRCRNPAPAFLARTATAAETYRLGLRLGLDCLGCCWALMAVMFAVGTMNVIWIAALAAVMTLEKLARGRIVVWAIGGGLIVAGALILLASPVGARLIAAF
jgi:predicted metal-binding membrane protein